MNSRNFIQASQYCEKVFDGTHDTPKPTTKGFPLVTSKHIVGGKLDLTTSYNISEEDYKNVNRRSRVKQWDVLFSMIGSIGEVYLETQEDIPYAIKNVGVFSSGNEERAKWLYYYLKSPYAKKHISNYLSGAVQKFLSLGALREFPIIPFDSEKSSITSVLCLIDQKIELNNKINTELEDIAKTLYDYWFVQFDFPDENGNPYKSSGGKMDWSKELKRKIPKGWEVDFLSNHLSFTRGISYTSKNISEEVGCPMVNLNSFYLDGRYKHEGLKYYCKEVKKDKSISPGSLMIAVTDVTRNADIIGKSFILPDIFDEENVTFSMDTARVNSDSFSKYYLNLLFNSESYHNYIKYFATGTLVLHLNLDGINWLKSFIPPSPLLERFDKILEPINAQVTKNIKENIKLESLRDWLLPMLMNGQIKVNG